jgi:hypothetical protein
VQPVAITPQPRQNALFERVWGVPGDWSAHPDGPLLARIAVSVEQPLTVSDAQALVAAALGQDSTLSPGTRKVRGTEVGRFWRHLGHHGVRLIAEASPDITEEFIHGAARSGTSWAVPAGSTQKNRRAAVRYAFEVLRGVGFLVGDPTLDLDVAGALARRAKPLTDTIIRRLQAAAPHELIASRRAVVLALAQAGATNTEITRVAASDLDLAAGTVSLPGGTRIDPRTNLLTRWGKHVLGDITAGCKDTSTALLPISAKSAASTVSNTLGDLSKAAALRPSVTVDDIRAWRARRLFKHTKSIEDVARFLGTRSLDVAADVVGYHWRVGA